MSPLKAFGTVAIMIACFVVVYPRFMHPFVLRALGLYEPPKNDADSLYPPHYKAMHPGGAKPQAAPDDARKPMRGPPHPGMRGAAETQRQQSQQGTGRGMMGMVLPMYAIGIVLYLIYTLFKVFNKSKSNSWHEGSQYENRLNRDYPVDRLGLPVEYDGSGDVRNLFTDDEQRMELEHLLTRVDDKDVSVNEMRMLQKRLEETEAQMSRILQAMQSVQTNVSMNNPQDSGVSKTTSNDVSPDVESCEVVDQRQLNEKGGKHSDDENDSRGKKGPETEKKMVPSNNEQENVDSKAQKVEAEDGSDKEKEKEVEAESDDREEEENRADAEIVEGDGDTTDATKTTASNIRQRKGRRDNEQ